MATHMQVPEEAPTLAVPKDLKPDAKPATRTVSSMMGGCFLCKHKYTCVTDIGFSKTDFTN